MPGGVGAHFAMVDQATNMLKKVEQYLSAGIETTIDVALDYVEHNKGIKLQRRIKMGTI